MNQALAFGHTCQIDCPPAPDHIGLFTVTVIVAVLIIGWVTCLWWLGR